MDIRTYLFVKYTILMFRFKRWMFRWVQDDEGDIGLCVFNIVTFIKYKESTIIMWFEKYPPAPRRLVGLK